MIIAVDFDGTIVEHRYPKIGKEIPFAIATLKKLQKERNLLILWTVREGELLDEAVNEAWNFMRSMPIIQTNKSMRSNLHRAEN